MMMEVANIARSFSQPPSDPSLFSAVSYLILPSQPIPLTILFSSPLTLFSSLLVTSPLGSFHPPESFDVKHFILVLLRASNLTSCTY